MNKFFIATAIVVAMTGSALAHKRTTHTNNAGAVVTEKGVNVRAPVGSDVEVDVDGRDVDVSVDGPDRGVLGLGVMGL